MICVIFNQIVYLYFWMKDEWRFQLIGVLWGGFLNILNLGAKFRPKNVISHFPHPYMLRFFSFYNFPAIAFFQRTLAIWTFLPRLPTLWSIRPHFHSKGPKKQIEFNSLLPHTLVGGATSCCWQTAPLARPTSWSMWPDFQSLIFLDSW